MPLSSRVPNKRSIFFEALAILSLVMMTISLHLIVPGVVPSGPDGGNWLAMAQDRFLGLDVMSAAVTYPPFLPALLALLILVMEPLAALVTVALIAKCSVVIAIYVCARPTGRFYAAVAASLVGVAGAQLEAYAWGAYPQMLGMAFGILAVYLAVRYVDSKRRVQLFAAVAFALLTYATHTLVGGLLVFALPAAAVHQLWMLRATREGWIRGFWTVVVLATPGALNALNNQVLNAQPGVQPVLNPLSLDWTVSLQQTIAEAPIPWIVLAMLGVGALVFRRWTSGRSATAAVGFAWVIVGVMFFVVIGEPRALLLAQVGLILLALLFFQRVLDMGRSASHSRKGGWFTRASLKTLMILGVATFSAIVVGSVDRYANSTSWYRVVDHQELRALDFLEETASEGDLVVASQGHHGNQMGWWVQGYAGIPTYTGVDLRFLTFPEEREQAEITNEFFAQTGSRVESLRTLQSIGADFLVVDRRGPDAGWLESRLAGEFEWIYDSPSIVVLEVATPEP